MGVKLNDRAIGDVFILADYFRSPIGRASHELRQRFAIAGSWQGKSPIFTYKVCSIKKFSSSPTYVGLCCLM